MSRVSTPFPLVHSPSLFSSWAHSTLALMTVDLVGSGQGLIEIVVTPVQGWGCSWLPDCIRSLTSTISNESWARDADARSTWRNEFHHQWREGGKGRKGRWTKYLPLTVQESLAVTIWISQAIDFYLITTTMKRSTARKEGSTRSPGLGLPLLAILGLLTASLKVTRKYFSAFSA